MGSDLFQKVRDLGLPVGQYTIFGSGPMCIRGLKDCSHDLDLVVTRKLYDEYKNKEGWKTKIMPNEYNDEYLEKDEIELYYNWRPGEWNIKELIDDSEVIENLPFVRLETVVKWKKMSARDKDLEHIKIIEEYLKNH